MLGVRTYMFTAVALALWATSSHGWSLANLPNEVLSDTASVVRDAAQQVNIRDTADTLQEIVRGHTGDTVGAFSCDDIDIFLRESVGAKLPETKGSTHTSVGTLHYDIKNMVVKSINNASCEVKVHLTSVDLIVSKLDINMHGDWDIKLGSIHADGPMDVEASGISIALNATLPSGNEGLNKVLTCRSNIPHLDIDLHGSTGWFYQPFLNHYIGTIKTQIDTVMCNLLTTGKI